ncbi:hypothetical protein SAMN04488001_1535 [Litoreibacter albidus]|uniref:Uncharacterized protein n=1 Tax=Litoreibacter albidus TaxID=670155 RepID=A0A1H2VIG3_9RHOB|nr:hypothetical protein SAMN04488001_1535 [Litoreibacter albidus]
MGNRHNSILASEGAVEGRCQTRTVTPTQTVNTLKNRQFPQSERLLI